MPAVSTVRSMDELRTPGGASTYGVAVYGVAVYGNFPVVASAAFAQSSVGQSTAISRVARIGFTARSYTQRPPGS